MIELFSIKAVAYWPGWYATSFWQQKNHLGRAHLGPSGNNWSIIKEQLTEFAIERIKEDSLDRMAGGVGPVLAPAAGYAGVKPVGRFVAGTGKSGSVNEGLQEHDALVAKGQPAVRQPADIGGKYPGCEVFDFDPGKDKEANVAGHLVKVDKPVLVIPADETVAGSDSQGGAPPSQGGHRAAIERDEVLEVRADNSGVAQIMVGLDQVTPETFLGGAADHGKVECTSSGCITAERGGIVGKFSATGFSAGPDNGRWVGGMFNAPFLLQGKEHNPTGTVLERAVRLKPVPAFAEKVGEDRTALSPIFDNQATDKCQDR